MSGHEVEISKLQEVNRQLEFRININKANISELEATDQRKQAASQTRDGLIKKALNRLIDPRRHFKFDDPRFQEMFRNNIVMINKDLDGNAETVTPEELKELILKKVEAI
jgi:hypothetical protein